MNIRLLGGFVTTFAVMLGYSERKILVFRYNFLFHNSPSPCISNSSNRQRAHTELRFRQVDRGDTCSSTGNTGTLQSKLPVYTGWRSHAHHRANRHGYQSIPQLIQCLICLRIAGQVCLTSILWNLVMPRRSSSLWRWQWRQRGGGCRHSAVSDISWQSTWRCQRLG